MVKSLVIVESPTKAKTIEKFLGKNFEVRASFGHVRDLPNSAAEIPAKFKKQPWSRLGVNVDADFDPIYVIPGDKKKHVEELKKLLENAEELLLATDEDREGESISWHLLEVLKPKVPVKRLVFHEITKEAISKALGSTRQVDENLVKAQETRRILDRLFGYSISPLLWRKVGPRLSAGRVQSVSTRLLVERERERMRFKKSVYWDLKAKFAKGKEIFPADLTQVGKKRIAIGKDFDPLTGALASEALHLSPQAAGALRERLLAIGKARVAEIEEKPFTQKPAPPFTTSTLQQEGNRKLGFAARRTMQVAQKLYENGVITYMRTDSTTLSEEALQAARSLIARDFGPQYLSSSPRLYKTNVKNAQEAHEAIRPAGTEFIPLDVVRAKYGEEAFRLYELIWKRTVASQMKDAEGTRVAVQLQCEDCTFRASGKTISFAGFLRAYVEGSDDPEADLADQEVILPAMKVGEDVAINDLQALEHETQPPARYTEGSLIKELERRGIGRPSTWATIVDVVLSRAYAFKRGNALVPTFLATVLTGLMERYFTNLLDYDFTARMEDDLDAISRGETDNLRYLREFYFGNGHPGVKTLVEEGNVNIDPRQVCAFPLGSSAEGKNLEVRVGRYGPFLTDGETSFSLPEEMAPDELSLEKATDLLREAAKGPTSLGLHPDSQAQIYLKKGRFGPYLQLGEPEEGKKPKMASLLPNMLPESVTLAQAVDLLALPKVIGANPENGSEVKIANGRFGPYVQCGSESRSVAPTDGSILDLTLEQALEILKRPKTRGRGGRAAPAVLKDFGEHPESKKKIVLREGRFGPYVSDGEINASVPRGISVEELSIEQAVELLAARAAAGPSKKKRGAARTGKARAKKAA